MNKQLKEKLDQFTEKARVEIQGREQDKRELLLSQWLKATGLEVVIHAEPPMNGDWGSQLWRIAISIPS